MVQLDRMKRKDTYEWSPEKGIIDQEWTTYTNIQNQETINLYIINNYTNIPLI